MEASCNLAKAADVLAICIKDKIDSCMRAPPDVEIIIRGIRSCKEYSIRRVSNSPTTEPIEPPMKLKSRTPKAILWLFSEHVPTTAASEWPDFSLALARRLG